MTKRRAAMRSLKVSDAFKIFILDQLEELGDITPRPMFGALGLYHRDVFFAIVARDALYLKVSDATRAEFERRGMPPFQPYADRRSSMRYYQVPLDVLESPVELSAWARRAIAAASNRSTRRK